MALYSWKASAGATMYINEPRSLLIVLKVVQALVLAVAFTGVSRLVQ